jgi:hypothetical protein
VSEAAEMDKSVRSVEVITPHCAIFERWLGRTPNFENGLEWAPQGMGALRVVDPPYDAGYFENYKKLANTSMGTKITAARIELVRQWYGDGHVIDVGIGCGSFIQTRGGWTWGYDVAPHGIRWLEMNARWMNPYERKIAAVTLWDVLEHIPDPKKLFDNVTGWVFMSCPIVPGAGPPAEDWKHYKPREHCWYWTHAGLVSWMDEHGFDCKSATKTETLLGRVDIGTFAFRRRV